VYEVNVLETLEECKPWQASWGELVESMDYPSPFVHPDWILTAFKAHEAKWSPYILLIKNEERIAGLLPLYKKQDDFVRVLRVAGDCYYPDPLGLCCKMEDRQGCIKALQAHFKHCKDWDVLRLHWLIHDEALEWEKSRAIVRKSSIAPYIPLPQTFQDYLGEFKKKINFAIRKVKKFDKANGSYFSTQSPQKCKDMLDRLFVLHDKRSLERDIQSSFFGKDIVEFHNNLNDNCKSLYFHWLTFEGEVIAVLYGFLLQDRFFYYQISHDPKRGSLSPGAVLLYKSIEQCCEIGVKEFNFLQGDEGYKWKWTKNSRTLYTVDMYNSTVRGLTSRLMTKVRLLVKGVVGCMRKH